jgi:hypothetical protein
VERWHMPTSCRRTSWRGRSLMRRAGWRKSRRCLVAR